MSLLSYPHSMWRKKDVELLETHISCLTADSHRKWGSMSVAGMLAHCTLALEVYSREFDLPMHTRWYASLSRIFALSRLPFPHGIRLPFDLPAEDGLDFEVERRELLRALQRFHEIPPTHVFKPHFILGELNRKEFGMLAHKHTAHHLRQFGC